MSDVAFDPKTFDVSIGTVNGPTGAIAVDGLGEEGSRFSIPALPRLEAPAPTPSSALLEANGDFSAEMSGDAGKVFAHFGDEGVEAAGSLNAGPLTASGSIAGGVVDGKATLAAGGVTTGVVVHEGGAGDRSLEVSAGGDRFSMGVGMVEDADGLTSKGQLSAQPTDAFSLDAGLSTTTGGGKTTEAAHLTAALDTDDFDANLDVKGGTAGTSIDASAVGQLGKHLSVDGSFSADGKPGQMSEKGELALGLDAQGIAANLALAGKSPVGKPGELSLDAEALAQLNQRILAGGVAQTGPDGTFVGGEVVVLPTPSTAVSLIAGGGTQGAGARLQLDLAGAPLEGPRDVLDTQGVNAHVFAELGQAPALGAAIGNPDALEKQVTPGFTVGAGVSGKF
jgi:hypothetical protein